MTDNPTDDTTYHPEVIISSERLIARVRELGAQITRDYIGRELDVVTLINGGSMFTADLVRNIGVTVRQHYIGFTPYTKGNQTGEVRLTLDVAEPLHGRDVLLVDGIVVSGRTPAYIVEMIKLRRPASVALCVVGVKRKSVAPDLAIQYSGFDLGQEIVVGYGIGDGPYRTGPFLARAGE
jgi:hypoxanthine phosphoribosyltransferase